MTLNKYYKQNDYAEELLKMRKWKSSIKRDFRLLAKYFRHTKNMDANTIESKLIKLCESKGKDWFNSVTDSPYIDKAITNAFKDNTEIVQIESIPIMKAELDYINNLELEDKPKKILYGILALAKLKSKSIQIQNKNDIGMYFGGAGKESYKSLLEALNDKYTRTFLDKELHKIIKSFNELGLTRTTYSASLEVLFVNDIEHDGEVTFWIKDFDNLGLYWEYELGNPKVKVCEECNDNLIKVSGRNHIHCKRCYVELERKRKLRLWHKSIKYKTSGL